jgi:hypothetical protein
MPFQPKVPRPAKAGRKRGTPNKVTQDVRQAFARLLEANTDNLAEWLKRVAVDDPAKALDVVIRIAEYHIPKLARTEVSATPGSDPVRFIIQK